MARYELHHAPGGWLCSPTASLRQLSQNAPAARSPLPHTLLGLDVGRIAEEMIAQLSGLVGAKVTVTREVEAEIPSGTPDHVVRTVTENSRTLKFTIQGFEEE